MRNSFVSNLSNTENLVLLFSFVDSSYQLFPLICWLFLYPRPAFSSFVLFPYPRRFYPFYTRKLHRLVSLIVLYEVLKTLFGVTRGYTKYNLLHRKRTRARYTLKHLRNEIFIPLQNRRKQQQNREEKKTQKYNKLLIMFIF